NQQRQLVTQAKAAPQARQVKAVVQAKAARQA
ncbi:hypothetical protein Q97_03091, partial [Enterococcus faecalis EnGen0061]